MILRRPWTVAWMAGVLAAGMAGDGGDPGPVKLKALTPILKQRLEEADSETLPGLAEELLKRPAKSVPELMEALQVFWEGHPTRPGLREVDHVHLCSPYTRANWLLLRVTRIPKLALQEWNTNFRLADDEIPAWLAWWKAYDHVASSLWPEQFYQGRLAKAAGNGPRYSETSGWHNVATSEETQAAEGAYVLALATRGDKRPQDLKKLDTFIRKNHESKTLQRAAILAAGCLTDRAYRDIVRQGLLNPSQEIQCASAWAAGQLGDPWLTPDLKKMEKMPVAQPGGDLGLLVRTALILTGDEDTLLALQTDLTHKKENRRKEALQSLAYLPRERLRDVVAQALTQATDIPKLELSAVLALMGDATHLDPIWSALNAPDRPMRNAAVVLALQVDREGACQRLAGSWGRVLQDATDSGARALQKWRQGQDINASREWPMAFALLSTGFEKGLSPSVEALADKGADNILPGTQGFALMALAKAGKMEEARSLAAQVVKAQKRDGRWGPGISGWDDLQLLLGLSRVALEAPESVPSNVWKRCWNNWLAVQKSLSQQSGWEYSSRLDTALLTAIALPICKARMHGKPDCPEAQRSLQWLEQNLVLNPRAWDTGAHLTLYRQLYLMDLIGSVSGDQAFLKGRWRGQGAILLLKERQIRGGWNLNPGFDELDPIDTSYALLFLAHTPEEALRQE